jgi:hypothetical protein
MTDPTLTITVDRTSLSLSALVFSASLDANALGIVGYQPPALQQRIAYAPDSVNIHGSEAIAASYQQAVLGWDWIRDGATEAQVQTSFDEVADALAQFSFTITTQVSGATAQVWSADPGSMTPAARSYVDLVNPGIQVFSASVPVYPIAGA